MNVLTNRIFEISKKHRLCHIGSCLTALPIIQEIYKIKQPDEKFILSCGHMGLALYVVLESLGLCNAEEMLLKDGVHPVRGELIDCSTGSLGMGLTVAVGMALADRKKNVYCLISDGECAEGCVWESFSFIEKVDLQNLKIYVNANGWSAYEAVTSWKLMNRLISFIPSVKVVLSSGKTPFCQGLESHYYVMKDTDDAQIVC